MKRTSAGQVTMQRELTDILSKGMAGENAPAHNLEGVQAVADDDLLKSLRGTPDDDPEPKKPDDDPEIAKTQDDDPDESIDEDQPKRNDDSEEITTLSELADELGLSVEALYNLTIPMAGGVTTTLGDLKNKVTERFDGVEAVETQKQELAEAQRKLDLERAALSEQQQIPQELLQAEAALLKAQSDFNAIDWTTLEATNPGEASLQRQKMMEQIQQAAWQKSSVEQRLNQLQAGIQAQQQAKVEQYQAERSKRLHQLVPEWVDEVAMNRDKRDMAELFQEKFHMKPDITDFIADMADPSVTTAFRRLWQLEKAAKHVKEQPPLPRVVKPQAVRSSGRGRKAAVDKLRKAAAGSQDTRVKVSAIKALLS